MRIRIITPILVDAFNDEVLKEASQFKAQDPHTFHPKPATLRKLGLPDEFLDMK